MTKDPLDRANLSRSDAFYSFLYLFLSAHTSLFVVICVEIDSNSRHPYPPTCFLAIDA